MRILAFLLVVCVVQLVAGSLLATTIYVDDDAPGDPGPGDASVSDPLEDGTAAHPYDAVQEGIDAAIGGDTVQVTDGTYAGDGNRDLDFHGKAITLQSENGPDVTIIDCEGTAEENHRGFYFHSIELATTVVDGFTVRNGYVSGDDDPNQYGGGIMCWSSVPTIQNCTIVECFSASDGGGVFFNSSATILNCRIAQNEAEGYGGGIYCRFGASPTILGCTITSNTAYVGGGICCNEADAVIANCLVTANRGEWTSGGIHCTTYCEPAITNCTIAHNWAREQGGGLHIRYYCLATITNCTIVANRADEYGGGLYFYGKSDAELRNCMIWGNVGGQVFMSEAYPACNPSFYYCDVEGGWSGAGGNNISSDPLLTPDFHLTVGSPCVDWCPTGPADDLDGEARPFPGGGAFDIGSDEFVDSDSDGLPDWWESLHYPDPAADPDGDGLANLSEYEWGADPDNPDTDGDGRSDGDEVAAGTNPVHPDNVEKTYYVNAATGSDSYDGLASAWDGTHGPKAAIQAGIDSTVTGYDYVVLVADGVYTGDGNRHLDFEGKAITVRGNGPDAAIIDCAATAEDEYYGFYFHSGEGPDSVLDGLTIRNAYHGIPCWHSSGPTIRNCVITGNRGMGIGCWRESHPTITDCVISNNSGGAIAALYESGPTVLRCRITGNCSDYGGGIYCRGGSSIIADCVIVGNVASTGGGICAHSDSVVVTGCTIAFNESKEGGAIHCLHTSPSITNCVLWGNTPDQVYVSSGTPTLDYCDVQGGWSGAGANNVDVDPALTPHGNLRAGSPCIDWCPTGSASDVDGEGRPVDIPGLGYDDPPDARTYDIGADEFIDTDSDGVPDWWELEFFASSTAAAPLGDDDSDGLTNLQEYEELGTDPTNADTDGDGRTDGAELLDGTNPLHPDNVEKTYYVNTATGSDAYDGRAPTWDGTHGPKATIQAGIDATVHGWDYTVLVADGTYTGEGNRDIDFRGRTITVRSENGPESTVIDIGGTDQDQHKGFILQSGEGADALISGFTIQNGYTSQYGGGIYTWRSAVSVIDCVITDCRANSGGGIYLTAWPGDAPVISRCTVTNNSGGRGGGMYFYWCSPTISDCTITGNEATYTHGGGIELHVAPTTVINCTIAGNTAAEEGGGIRGGGSRLLTVVGCTVSGNAAEDGGGVYADNLQMSSCLITQNTGDDGAGVYFNSGSIAGCTITDNTAHTGGGVHCGGGTLANCIVAGNDGRYGGGIYCKSSAAVITNCTITENTCDMQGGGMYCPGTSPTVTNSILWSNSPQQVGVSSSASPTLNYCDIEGGWSGSGADNIDADPVLRPNWRLTFGSPCIDVCPSGPGEDIDGDARPFPAAGAYDIGADEFVDTDGDGMPDYWETANNFDPNDDTGINGADGDPDLDALGNLGEYLLRSDPWHPDPDGDGRNDSVEAADATNPTHPDNSEKTYYVNDATGNDAYDGLAKVWDGTHGPTLTIQAGIDATITGWGYTVLVADGTYRGDGNRGLDFEGREITLRSENGAVNTVIDCQSADRAFNFHSEETDASVLDGFTITGGLADYGGGIHCRDSSPTIANCIISANAATSCGGAVYCRDAAPTISNCAIIGNIASHDGGAIYGMTDDPILTSCTIGGNSAVNQGGGICCNSSDPVITDSILWGDSPEEIYIHCGTPVTAYSNIAGGTGEPWFDPVTCIDQDPLFVSGPLHDYYLSQIAAGQAADSPCVDAGSDTAANLGLDHRTTRTDEVPDEGIVDMGYHASPRPQGDVDGNGVVDGLDLTALLSAWECVPGDPFWDPAADLDGNGIIDGLDLTEVIANWTAGQ